MIILSSGAYPEISQGTLLNFFSEPYGKTLKQLFNMNNIYISTVYYFNFVKFHFIFKENTLFYGRGNSTTITTLTPG